MKSPQNKNSQNPNLLILGKILSDSSIHIYIPNSWTQVTSVIWNRVTWEEKQPSLDFLSVLSTIQQYIRSSKIGQINSSTAPVPPQSDDKDQGPKVCPTLFQISHLLTQLTRKIKFIYPALTPYPSENNSIQKQLNFHWPLPLLYLPLTNHRERNLPFLLPGPKQSQRSTKYLNKKTAKVHT